MKKSIIVLTSLILIFGAWLAYFFIANEAPLTKGGLDLNIEFKEGLYLDVYQPTTKIYEKSPVVIYVHGGAWIGGSKMTVNNNRFNFAFNELRDNGYAIVSPDYTLASTEKSPFPACIVDVEDAILWLKSNAETYHFDLDNLGIMGESAGGHIAMMIAFPDTALYALDYKKTKFNYVIDVYGPNDLKGIYTSKLADSLNKIVEELPEFIGSEMDISTKLFGFKPQSDSLRAAGMMQLYSPINFVNKNAPPVLMIHGEVDQVVPFSQSVNLALKLDSLKVKNEFHALADVNHGFIGANEGQMAKVQDWVSGFVLRHYRANGK